MLTALGKKKKKSMQENIYWVTLNVNIANMTFNGSLLWLLVLH